MSDNKKKETADDDLAGILSDAVEETTRTITAPVGGAVKGVWKGLFG